MQRLACSRGPVPPFVAPLIALLVTSSGAIAQVRMNLRNTMQIDGLVTTLPSPLGASPDSRCWPIEVNGFASGDVDGDGDLDLLAAASGNGSCRLWLNESGAFVRFVDIPFTGARCVLFDADGDGDLDALIGGGRVSYGGPTATGLFLNNGLGSFTYSPTTPTNPQALWTRSLSVGDIDIDGDLDVLLLGESPDFCLLWRNTGGAVFVDATANVQPPIASAAIGSFTDLDSDGDLDIVVKTGFGPLCETRVNDGSGSFQAGPSVPFTISTADAKMADVDGDGLLDQVGVRAPFSAPPSSIVYVRRNTGTGFQDVTSTWFEPHALIDHTVGFDAFCCEVFDVDGDGDPDLVTGGSTQKGATSTTVGVPPKVFLNIDGQRFRDAGRPAFPMVQDGATAVDAGDIDGDGDVDLVTWAWAHHGSAYADIWRQDGAGCFAEAGNLPFSSHQGISALKLADVDGDGDLDMFGIVGWGQVFPGVPGQHRLALNDGAGGFTEVTATHVPASANTGGASCAPGDVDGDGDIDVVIGSYDGNWGGPGVPLMLLVNNGTGVFANASVQMPATVFPSGHVALRDFDGDGDLDLVAALDRFHTSTRRLLFFANNGAGFFADETSVRLPSTTSSWGMSVLDLDGDGDLDIAQSDVNLLNDGSGVFSATTVASGRLAVLDLDEDGTADGIEELWPSTGNSSGVRVSGGNVLLQGRVNAGHSVFTVDLDQDGDSDVIAAALFDGGGGADWNYTRCEVVYNLTRDLRVVAHPRIGAPYRMQLRATNGTQPTVAVTLLAAQTLSPRVPVGTWGNLALDPAALIPWEAVVIPDSDTAVESVLNVPNQPGFLGLPLTCQALTIPIGAEHRTHFTNAMTHTIEE